MRVAMIQLIFDSLHFNGAGTHASSNYNLIFKPSNSNNKNNKTDSTAQQLASLAMHEELQMYSKRLSRKLQKATHLVLDLRDFFRHNITKLLRQPNLDYTEQMHFDDFNAEVVPASDDADDWQSAYLRSCIVAFQFEDSVPQQHYNKQQIQIVNYLQPDAMLSQTQQQLLTHMARHPQALQANAYIGEKLQQLRRTLVRTTDVYEVSAGSGMPTPSKAKLLSNHFKHIYFLSRSDDANADAVQSRDSELQFQQLYVSAIQRKYVLLLIDVGYAMSGELLELTKRFVSNVLQLLSGTDYISLLTIAGEAKQVQLEELSGGSRGYYAVTQERKMEIEQFMHSLSATHTPTNHTLGFVRAFELLHKLQNSSLLDAEQPVHFVYLTRGFLANLSVAMQVLQVIAAGQRKLQQPIIINTCAVVLDEKNLMHERQFLSDIATQNYSKYDNSTPATSSNLIGKFYVLTKTQPHALVQASVGIFSHAFRAPYLTESWKVHEPLLETSSKDAIVAITYPVAPYGVIGANLYLADLLEDISTYQELHGAAGKYASSYAFLVNREGVTISHPAFPRAGTQTHTPYPVDIAYLENATDFRVIRAQLLQDENGNASSSVYLQTSLGVELMERSYYWQQILGIYVLCLVYNHKPETPNSASNSTTESGNANAMPISIQRYVSKDSVTSQSTTSYRHREYQYLLSTDLLYHRLDLLPQSSGQVCRYFHQLATMDDATLFLSAAAFESPFTYVHNERVNEPHMQLRIVESIMAYLKDVTGLLANPGLRGHIRAEVNALCSAMKELKRRHQDTRGTLKHHIIRRYIASVSGVLLVYPGCQLSGTYDPTRRPWFRKALEQPGKIVSTAPYLDAGGAGYIVTLAHTIYEGRSHVLHSPERDRAVAVVAIDLPYAYYYRLLLDSTPFCQQHGIKCLLFEDGGYLLAHPSVLEVSNAARNPRRPHEHLTHKESFLANDMLNHKTLVRKLACADYQQRQLQRYYVFNTSLSEVLTNVMHGERTKYAIALVRGSNIFAALLNASCDGGAFCPCSTIDRVCLNCKRMDQMDCECPCECPMTLRQDYEAIALPIESNYTQQYGYCAAPVEPLQAVTSNTDPALLHACVPLSCDSYGTQLECLGVLGCEWCQQDVDGNGFAAPFCTSQTACFNGVLAALTPYGELDDDVDLLAARGFQPGQQSNSYSAFGPVGGAIVVLGLVIGFAIYCYRHNLDAHAQDQFYIDSVQEENYGLPLSRFNFDDCQAHDEPPGSVGGAYEHAAAQRNLIHPADISPYHMSTGSSYRRPPNGESDHGYSTMTPHEDSSDQQCFTLAEPLLLLHDKRHSKSDTLSISTSISSPTNRQQQQQQQLALHSAKELRGIYNNHNLTSPKKLGTASPVRYYEQVPGTTTLPLHDETIATPSPHYILAPVTVHRHMETSES